MTRKFLLGLVALMATFSTSLSTSARENENTYHAKEVYQVSDKYYSSVHTPYVLLGTNVEGYQIWAAVFELPFKPYQDRTRWFIDDADKNDGCISANTNRFETNTTYKLMRYYNVKTERWFTPGEYTHFLKVKGVYSAEYSYWSWADDVDSRDVILWSEDWFLTGSIDYSMTDPFYYPDDDNFGVNFTWNLKDFTDEVLDYFALAVRFDNEMEYTEVYTTTEMSGNASFRIGDSSKRYVEIKPIVHFKAKYAALYNSLRTLSYQRQDFELETCKTDFRVTSMRDNFEPSNGTYTAMLDWTCQDLYKNTVDQIAVDYSIDEGKTWKHGISGYGYKGTDSGKIHGIIAGCNKYIFRYQGFHNNAPNPATLYTEAYDTIEINYDPQIARFELAGSLTDNYDETANTFKTVVAYSLNRDLYEMSADKSTIEYSIDGGKFVEAAKFMPDADGTQQITVPATGKSYQFRLNVTATRDAKWTSYSAVSLVYQRFMGVDDIAIEDNAPADVYTIDGKLVAKQITPSEAKAKLANGTYIIGGKKLVIKK